MCPWATDVCHTVDPPPLRTPAGTIVHCHLRTEGPALGGAPVASVSVAP